jgi:hypothetical protein
VQLAADYLNGPVRVGYAGLQAKAPQNAAINANVFYHNLYANYDYGKGKVYAVFVRSNNIASNANGNNAGQVLGNVGGAVNWSSTGVNRTFEVYQVSADYNVDAQWRVGALWGRISDKSGAGQNANGGSIGAYYALSKRTTLSALWKRCAMTAMPASAPRARPAVAQLRRHRRERPHHQRLPGRHPAPLLSSGPGHGGRPGRCPRPFLSHSVFPGFFHAPFHCHRLPQRHAA